eukprot:m.269209 g.269209  ORF g.269209 m.269209 type:complete len:90 (-) comp41015_c0_seq1:11-280(-)
MNDTKSCHYHLVDAFLTLRSGSWYFKIPTNSSRILLSPGDQFITPAHKFHEEGAVPGSGPAVFSVTWSPPPPANNTINVPDFNCQFQQQ